jgi:hypothetical protein
MKGKVLLVNIDESPLNVLKMNKAINKWMKGKAEIVESIDDKYFFHEGKKHNFPSVIKMRYYVVIKKTRHLKDFYSKENVWKRDKGVCQYCNTKVSLDDFTVDHVIPKKHGGKGVWKNIVTACFPCNNKKDCNTLKESGLKLLKKPEIPKLCETIQQTILYKFRNLREIPHNSWKKYIK